MKLHGGSLHQRIRDGHTTSNRLKLQQPERRPAGFDMLGLTCTQWAQSGDDSEVETAYTKRNASFIVQRRSRVNDSAVVMPSPVGEAMVNEV